MCKKTLRKGLYLTLLHFKPWEDCTINLILMTKLNNYTLKVYFLYLSVFLGHSISNLGSNFSEQGQSLTLWHN